MATRFEQITSVQYQAISHTDNQNLQFYLKSKKLRKLTKKLIIESTECSEQCEKNSFKYYRGETYVLIHRCPISHYKEASFSSKSYFLFS